MGTSLTAPHDSGRPPIGLRCGTIAGVTTIDSAADPFSDAATATIARGKAARKIITRTALGDWDPARRGHDPLQTILSQNTIRDQRLVPMRHGRMAASPWTYYRGAAAVMAADLASRPNTGIEVQLCGDAHVLNFGLWNTPERSLAFDLRDFDETLPGPFEWDVQRFLASLVVLARDNGAPDDLARKAVRAGFEGYRRWMGTYADWPELDIWYEQIDVAELAGYLSDPADGAQVDAILEKQARKRSSRGASKKLTQIVDGRRRIVEAPPYRVHALADYTEVLSAVISDYTSTVPDHIIALLKRFDVVDAVQQVVGVGSVGMRVFLILNEERATGDPLFFQVKQATASVYEQFLAPSRHDNHGARVVNGQRLIQSATDMFVGWTRIPDPDAVDMDFYVRQFRDGKVIPKGDVIVQRLPEFATACGHVLARAHARSGDPREIVGYLGSSSKGVEAMVSFAVAYADQTERDHAELAAAVADGTIPSAPGWP